MAQEKTALTRLTKALKIEILLYVLKELKSKEEREYAKDGAGCGICILLSRRTYLPENIKTRHPRRYYDPKTYGIKRPKRANYNDWWWPTNAKGRKTRIKKVIAAINKLKRS